MGRPVKKGLWAQGPKCGHKVKRCEKLHCKQSPVDVRFFRVTIAVSGANPHYELMWPQSFAKAYCFREARCYEGSARTPEKLDQQKKILSLSDELERELLRYLAAVEGKKYRPLLSSFLVDNNRNGN